MFIGAEQKYSGIITPDWKLRLKDQVAKSIDVSQLQRGIRYIGLGLALYLCKQFVYTTPGQTQFIEFWSEFQQIIFIIPGWIKSITKHGNVHVRSTKAFRYYNFWLRIEIQKLC